MRLRERHRDVLRAVETYMARSGGVAPSLREVARVIGVRSPSHIKLLVDELVDGRRIERLPKHKRAMRVSAPAGVFRFDDKTKSLVRVN